MSEICTNIPESCDNCYELNISNNNSTVIDTNIPISPGTYYLWMIDSFGNNYQEILTIASQTNIQIDTTQFPPGMFNQYGGFFNFFLTSDSEGNDIVPVIIDSVSYNCFIVTITCVFPNNSPDLQQTEANYIMWITEDGNFIQIE